MKLKHFRPALQYAFSRQKKTLSSIIHDDKDVAMATYVLEQHPEQLNAASLGIGLVWAVGEAKKDHQGWLEVAQLIRQHPAATEISPSIIASTLNDCAGNKNIRMTEELLRFPQVSAITSLEWDNILFECLPKGDPEKKRIEKRSFEDKDGDPQILKMVRAAMKQKPATTSSKPTLS